HQKQRNKGKEYQAQITPDREKLQDIEPGGGVADADRDRRVKAVPDQIAQTDDEARWPCVARRRHVDLFAGTEGERAEDAADRLRETAGGVLRGRCHAGEAATPGRSASRHTRSEAVNEK